jgi:hypothetical protein
MSRPGRSQPGQGRDTGLPQRHQLPRTAAHRLAILKELYFLRVDVIREWMPLPEGAPVGERSSRPA